METIILKTDLSCKHCVANIEPLLKENTQIADYKIDLEHPDRLVTISSNNASIAAIISQFKSAGYSAEKL